MCSSQVPLDSRESIPSFTREEALGAVIPTGLRSEGEHEGGCHRTCPGFARMGKCTGKWGAV